MNSELFARCVCQSCGGSIEFPIEMGGIAVACPHCQQATELNLEAAPAVSSGQPSAAELLAAFGEPVPPTRTSFFYKLGLLLVTFVMILLPVIYLAMIGGAAWGVYFFATRCSWLFASSTMGSVRILMFLVYSSVLFSGLVLVLFMIKPLFAPRAPHSQPLAMNPAAEPTLFAFIARICDSVGAPMPTRIDLNCDFNAAAGFRRGFYSMFKTDLVLTIGLPLVAAMSLREFAGVVAHEFGHFTQGFGMRLSYIVRRINGWFARVVYERDAWDLWLSHAIEESVEADMRLAIIPLCARIAVGVSRLLLAALMHVGHALSCFLMRQMEYDADSYEIKLAGSATFETTARKLAVYHKALGQAYERMDATFKTNRSLPDNFPAYLVDHQSRMPAHVRAQVEDKMGLEKTKVFDSHPSGGDRIRCARRAQEPGIFHVDLPATVLFSNFDVVAKQVTQLHYAEDLEIPVAGIILQPIGSMPRSHTT